MNGSVWRETRRPNSPPSPPPGATRASLAVERRRAGMPDSYNGALCELVMARAEQPDN